MTTGATGQLGLALPVQGELSGTWGDTVNNGITQYTNIAIAATLTLTNDGAVTLANTTGDATASNIVSSLTGAGTVTAQFAIVRVTGTLTTAKVVTAPSYSKTYTVVNAATGGIVTFKASGQTGVSIAVGESAFVYYNGTDYVKVSSTVATGVTSFQTSLSGLTPSTSTTGAVTLAGTLGTSSGGTNLTSFTSGGVVYASSSSALATGSAVQYDGSQFSVTTAGNNPVNFSSTSTSNTLIQLTNSNASKDLISRFRQTSGSGNWWDLTMEGSTNGFTFDYNDGEILRLTSAGNVGIGTTSPAGRLHVVNSAGVCSVVADGQNAAASGGIFTLRKSGVDTAYLCQASVILGGASTSNDLVLYSEGATNQRFYTNQVERARFSSAGGFSVGTTSDPGAGAIYATGNITAYYSDARLKTVSGKIENALDKVAQLSGVYYTNNSVAKSFGYDSDEEQVGVIAQEVEAVLPQIVKAAPFDLDENNNSKSGENYKTVQYDKLVPLLIEAINELQAKVKALETK